MKKTKRKLRPWVINTIKGITSIALTVAVLFGLLVVMTEAHYQRVDYWNEVSR